MSDAGFLSGIVGMLRVDDEPPADEWSVVYASFVGLPLVLSSDKFDPDVGVVGFDEFEWSLSVLSVKVIPGVGVSWSLIFKIYVSCYVCWEIVLLSPKDLYELVTESSICLGRHFGNSSVFQELVEKPNLC